jgi:hypothetical protein
LCKTLLLTMTLLIYSQLAAQEENWDVYVAQYNKGPASIMLNMGLKKIAPVTNLPFVLVTGVKFKDCPFDGMPSQKEFTNLYKISDSVKTTIDSKVKNNLVGAFTYQCERLDYFYVADTTGLRQQLTALYKNRFSSYIPYINIKADKEWKGYLDFLYPNEEAFEFMQNQKVIIRLQKEGDKLNKERQVDHWLYFSTEADRNCFISYAVQKNFKIESKEKTANLSHPFKLHLSRTDKVDMASISKITLELRRQAKKCNGEYDGWETFVIK